MKTVKEPSDRLMKSCAWTIELCGTSWSVEATEAAMTDLVNRFPEEAVMLALERCRLECKGRLTMADIMERVEDGRPGADEAWAQVGTLDEQRSLVTTAEALEAWGEVRDLLRDDEVGARMAFRDAYKRIVSRNKANGVPVKWTVSLGQDAGGRESALRDAAERKKLDTTHAAMIAGHASNDPKALPAGKVAGFLPEHRGPQADINRQRFAAIREAMHDPEALAKLQEEFEREEREQQKQRDLRARAAGDRS